MYVVGLEVLKNKLSEYVRLVAGGETVLITDRDRVVAELGPPSVGHREAGPDASLTDAIAAGLVTPVALPPGPPPKTDPLAALDDVLAELNLARADR